MPGLVPELRNNAVESDIDMLVLLRKAFTVAKLLNIQSTQAWLNYELEGYPKTGAEPKVALPSYRVIAGEIHCKKANGTIEPSAIDRACLSERLFHYEVREGIDRLWMRIQQNNKPLTVAFNGSYSTQVQAAMHNKGEPVLLLPTVEILTMFQKVRTAILTWATDLEQQNIIGENMSFNDNEKQAAVNVSIQSNSNNSSGNTSIGNVSEGQVMVNSAGASQVINKVAMQSPELPAFITELKEALPQLNLNEEKTKEVNAEISTVEIQLDSPKPKEIIMKESLTTIRDILVGITGSVLATGLIQSVNTFL